MNDQGEFTQKASHILKELQTSYDILYCAESLERQLSRLEYSAGLSCYPSQLAKLYHMLDALHISYLEGQSVAYYAQLIRASPIPSSKDADYQFLYALYQRFDQYLSPEAYMKRILDRLPSSCSQWKDEPVRLRLLKHFIKSGNYLSDAGYGGKAEIKSYVRTRVGHTPSLDDVLQTLDDHIFDDLETVPSELKKPKSKYGLLAAVDDLAAGRFHESGGTKKLLYFLAMVLDMTYDPDPSAKKPNTDTDLEANFFIDYYNNNIMRFLCEADPEEENSADPEEEKKAAPGRKSKAAQTAFYEPDPSGQGINYKNFAEVIYLYYLSQPLEPQEKIARSCQMIKDIMKHPKAFSAPGALRGGTDFYHMLLQPGRGTNDHSATDFLSLDEEHFKNFIRTHFSSSALADAASQDRVPSTGICFHTNQESAFRVYSDIIRELNDCAPELPEDGHYGLWFTDTHLFSTDRRLTAFYAQHPEISPERFVRFKKLLNIANRLLMCPPHVSSSSSVTRTSIIVAFYYLFNAKYNPDDSGPSNKSDLFSHFESGLNVKLEEAYYQPLSAKNIFDVLVVFSAYSYLNM